MAIYSPFRMTSLVCILAFALAIGVFQVECREENSATRAADAKPELSVRPFYMGFSSCPYDLTLAAVQWTDTAIKAHGDIIEQHFEEGVPWQEALENKPYDPAMRREIADRARRMGGCKRVVSINPINMARNGLANYRGKSCKMPLRGEWKERRFNDPAVKQAYLQYCKQIIQSLRPDFLLIGVEVNLLQRCKDSSWQDYMELHRFIYGALKKSYPGLPVMASVVSTSYFPGLCSEDNAADQLYRKIPNVPLMIVWRDTGLFDEGGRPRQALQIWDAVLKRRRQGTPQ